MLKRIEFDERYGIMCCQIGWGSVYCPNCNQFHSQCFVPDLEYGKSEYEVQCCMCKEKAIVDMGSIERNDSILDGFKAWENRGTLTAWL